MSEDKTQEFVKKACAKISNDPKEVVACELDLQRLMDSSKEFQKLRTSMSEAYKKPPEEIDKAIREAYRECAPCQLVNSGLKKEQAKESEATTEEKQATPEKTET